MSNPNGKKGSAFERVVADGLTRELEPDLADLRDRTIDRRPKTGSKDRGDIAGVRTHGQRLVIEVKCEKTTRLGAYVAEAEIERGNDDALAGFTVHKRRGFADFLDQYVTMTGRDLIALLTGERPPR